MTTAAEEMDYDDQTKLELLKIAFEVLIQSDKNGSSISTDKVLQVQNAIRNAELRLVKKELLAHKLITMQLRPDVIYRLAQQAEYAIREIAAEENKQKEQQQSEQKQSS